MLVTTIYIIGKYATKDQPQSDDFWFLKSLDIDVILWLLQAVKLHLIFHPISEASKRLEILTQYLVQELSFAARSLYNCLLTQRECRKCKLKLSMGTGKPWLKEFCSGIKISLSRISDLQLLTVCC